MIRLRRFSRNSCLRCIGHVVAAATVAAALAAGPSFADDLPVLAIATQGADPPFSVFHSDGTLTGFEIDLGNALCAEMGMTCQFLPQEDRKSLVPGLLAHRYDAVMSSMEITADRRKTVAFSEKYEEVPAAFVARKSAAITDTGPGALVGRRLGAQEDTVYADYLLRHLAPAGATVRLYATIGEAELDLAAGNLDAILGNKVALMAWTARGDGQNCCVFAGYDLHDPAEFGAGVGIALRPDDNALRMRINSALATLLANGTYERIDRKYFPFSIY